MEWQVGRRPNTGSLQEQGIVMKKIWTLTLLALAALSMSGCGCNRPFMSWFNRSSDNCGPPPCNTSAGMPFQAGSPVMLGPVESGPAPVYGAPIQ
ncbi:hypothetical protein [Anatilimnocola aggregata]|nr:hypothetical protein [Anatilimnocola aggregata]